MAWIHSRLGANVTGIFVSVKAADFPGCSTHTLPLADDDSAPIGPDVFVKSLPIPGLSLLLFFSCVGVQTCNQLLLFWAVAAAAPRDKIACQERGQAVQL